MIALSAGTLCAQVPTITSFTPTSGPVGTTVTITGTNFDPAAGNNIVWFGAVRATVTAASPTELTVTVPFGTTYQPISVTAGGLTAYTARPWDVSFSSTRNLDMQSLDTKIDFPAGSEPYAGSVCDIDVDGMPDMIFVNRESDNVSILRNVTDMHGWSGSSFETRYNLDTGEYPVSVATDDIDGDGKKDIVVANFVSNTISVFRNTSVPGTFGPGSLAAKVDFTAGGNPQCVIIADIDIDGKPDLIFTNHTTNTVSILKNTSTLGTIDAGSFAARVDFVTGNDPRFVVLGHIDTDVKPDIVVSNYGDNTISVLRNKITAGTIDFMSFDTRVNFTTGMNPYALAIEDLDINGRMDVIVSNLSDNSISIFSNAGEAGDIVPGSLNDRVNFPTGAQPVSFSIGDVDGDGKRDIVVANQFHNSISVLRNTSIPWIIDSGSLAGKVDFPTWTYPSWIGLCDFDMDSKPDITVLNANSNVVSFFRNKIPEPSPPVISSFTPASGPVGTEVVITGSGFSEQAVDNTVNFGTIEAIVTAATANQLTVTVPAGAISDFIYVTVNGLTAASGISFIVTLAPPVILSFTPASGSPGTAVTITGSNFSSNVLDNIVRFGTVPAAVTSATGTQLIVTVPEGATTQPIYVEVNGMTAFTTAPFVVVPPPLIYSFSPDSGPVGTTVTINGLNFSSTPADNDVFFGTTQAAVLAATATQLTVTVPSGATNSVISVRTYGQTANAASPFTVTEPTPPPVITSFSPASGPVGATVTITGTFFSPTPANNIVKFGTIQAVVTAATTTQLTVILPAGSTDNPISVTVNGLTGSSATSFVVTAPSPPPVITSLSQTFGYIGMTLIINGTNFSTTPANNIVWFGAVKANVTAATATQLQVTVPAGATYQPVTVTVNGLTAYSQSPFIVTFPSLQIFDGSTLAPKVEFPCSSGWSYFAVICDIDVDGKPDLIGVNAGGSGNVLIYRNTGNPGSISTGSFTAGVELAISGGAYGIAVGDIDGDGKPDLAVTSNNNNIVTVFRNQSTPGSITSESFEAGIDFQTGSRPTGIALGDIDGDGKTDIVVSNYGDGVSQSSWTVSVFKNTGMPGSISSGSFAPKVDFQSSHGGVYVALNDLDMDGKPDLIITTFTTNISIFRNTTTSGAITTGSFAPKVDISASNGLNSSAVGDIDGDGKPDLVFVNNENSSVSVLRNVSTPGSITRNSFSPSVDFHAGANSYEVDLGDIDGDGKPDMVVANNDNTIISLFKNSSSPGSINSESFNPKIDFNIGSGQGTLAIGDLDGDTKPDIFVKHWYSNTISILRNNMPTPNLPVINSINPNSGPVGSTVTINGSNFSPVAENNTIMFGTAQGTVTSATNNQLTVTVPAGADGQDVIIMVYGYWINSGITFSVVAPENIELESAILTLNGDGINEVFRVKNFQAYGQCKFYVYNSRGAVVYWNDDFQGEWDVTLHSRRFDTGGYFYVIETAIGTFRGSFSILRN